MSFIEIHLLQNFAPSNLNRDDTGSPKECEFGGYRRARISSQCQKRAVRRFFKDSPLFQPDELAVRTKRLAEAVSEILIKEGCEADKALVVAQNAVEALGIKPDKKRPGLTGYLVFLSPAEIQSLALWAKKNWQKLIPHVEVNSKNGAGVPADLKAKLEGVRAADLALFGRMLADMPDDSIDAAVQVAHAISTNRVSVEFDYYTAVDDRQPDDTAAADMVGTVEFNSACYYRYANVNLNVLWDSLPDEDLARRTTEAFVRGFILSVPTGKQNSMAAHNPPSFVLAVSRSGAPCNLSNAFVKPVQPRSGKSLIEASVEALDGYWGRLCKKFGTTGLDDLVAWTLDDQVLSSIPEANVVARFDQLVARICQTAARGKVI